MPKASHSSQNDIDSSTASTSRLPPPPEQREPSSDHSQSRPHTLQAFQQQEGAEQRKRRLHELWVELSKTQQEQLQQRPSGNQEVAGARDHVDVTEHGHHDWSEERAKKLKSRYNDELLGRCKLDPSGSRPSPVTWEEFQKYADAKEAGPSLSPHCICQLHLIATLFSS